jgi:aminomethyltransferase
VNPISGERNGVEVPLHFGEPDAELRALRTRVAVADLPHVGLVRLRGSHAWELADRALPCDLTIREGQARQTLLLDPDGSAVADVMIVRHAGLFLWVDGLPVDEVCARLEEARRPGEDASVEPLRDTIVLEVTGPYAWELMARFSDPGIVGQPYLTFARLDGGLGCIRAGRSGEYAYDLLVSRDESDAVRDRLLDLGGAMEIRRVGTDGLDHAALENWFFNPHAEGARGLTPLHLQLQWRISRRKDFPGAEALAAVRQRGLDRRLTGVSGPAGLAAGQLVVLEDATVGEIVVAASDRRTGEGSIGLALLDVRVAESGMASVLAARGAGRELPIATVSPPFVVNRSLLVSPHRDSWASRGERELPPGTWV